MTIPPVTLDPDRQRTVLVTGAAGSIGTAVVHRLLRDGWRVGCLDIDTVGLDRLVANSASNGDRIAVRRCDVTDDAVAASAIPALIDDLEAPLFGVVNAAMRWQRRGSLVEFAGDDWDADMRSLLGTYRSVSALASVHLRRGGSIVNVSSVHGMLASAGWGSYDVAKAAILQLTRVLGAELGSRGIRVNTVSPGIIEPRTPDDYYAGRPSLRALHAAASTLQTVGRPDDVAGAIAFLLGSDSRFITGHNLVVDGGMTSMLQLTALDEYDRVHACAVTPIPVRGGTS